MNLFSSTSGIHLFRAMVWLALTSTPGFAASFTNFTDWTSFDDPPNANFSSSSTSTSATFNAANGPIPTGTDIGFASIDENTAATSTQGFVFSTTSSFTLAVSYNLILNAAVGNIGLGFGIGEDVTGMNSAGVAFQSADTGFGRFNGVAGAARVNDVGIGGTPALASFVDANGTMFLTYDGTNGNITLGWADAVDSLSASVPDITFTGSTVSDNWNNEPLLVSIFMRSDATGGSAWTSGTAEGVFSNLRVISGSPIVVPEPSSALLASLGLGFLALRRQRRFGNRPV